MAANRAEFIHRLIPKRHITCGVGAAAIEITSSAGFSLYQMSLSTFRTGNSRVNNNGFVGSAFRTMEIPSIRSILVHHKCPAFFTRLIRFLFRLIVHIKWFGIMACRIIRAGQIFPKTTKLNNHRWAALFAYLVRHLFIVFPFFFRMRISFFQLFAENTVEVGEYLKVCSITFRNLIQPLFHICSKADIHNTAKVFLQQFSYLESNFCRNKLLPIFFHILSSLDSIQNSCIGRRTANPLFFQCLDEAGFGKSWRRCCKMLFAFAGYREYGLALFKWRQIFLRFPLCLFTGRRFHNDGKPVKHHMRAAGSQPGLSAG